MKPCWCGPWRSCSPGRSSVWLAWVPHLTPKTLRLRCCATKLVVLRRQIAQPYNTPVGRMFLAALAKQLLPDRWPRVVDVFHPSWTLHSAAGSAGRPGLAEVAGRGAYRHGQRGEPVGVEVDHPVGAFQHSRDE